MASVQQLHDFQPCWWCGHHAMVVSERRTRFYNDDCMGRDICDAYSVKCGNRAYCGTFTAQLESRHSREYEPNKIDGVADPKAEVLALWETGEVTIPLTIVLPENLYVVERRLLPTKYTFLNPTLLTIEVTRDRGIADRLKRNLSAVIASGETIRPHKFTLNERNAHHVGVVLKSFRLKAFDMMEFVFETAKTNRFAMKNKSDTAWLKQPVIRPPVFDRVFDILAKEDAVENIA